MSITNNNTKKVTRPEGEINHYFHEIKEQKEREKKAHATQAVGPASSLGLSPVFLFPSQTAPDRTLA
jgi:hypothetical protein